MCAAGVFRADAAERIFVPEEFDLQEYVPDVGPGTRRAAFSLQLDPSLTMAGRCKHLSEVRDVKPSAQGCEDCLKTGDTWLHLRMCLSYGHVGCCDSSKNKHATKHSHTTDRKSTRRNSSH